jgi:hypothetical protein
LQIDDRAIDSIARLDDDDSAAWKLIDIVRRAKQARLAREIVVDLALVPDVVAAGEDVDAVAEDLVGKCGGDAESAGRVFGVRDSQMDIFSSDDFFEVPGDQAPADGAEDVAYKK